MEDDVTITGSLFVRAANYIPELGLPGGGDTVGVLNNAPHKAAAMLFAAFLIESDIQLMMNEIAGSTPARIYVTIKLQLVTEEERQENGRAWIAGQYKDKFKSDFEENVIMM